MRFEIRIIFFSVETDDGIRRTVGRKLTNPSRQTLAKTQTIAMKNCPLHGTEKKTERKVILVSYREFIFKRLNLGEQNGLHL